MSTKMYKFRQGENPSLTVDKPVDNVENSASFHGKGMQYRDLPPDGEGCILWCIILLHSWLCGRYVAGGAWRISKHTDRKTLELCGRIQRKPGSTRNEIENFCEKATNITGA